MRMILLNKLLLAVFCALALPAYAFTLNIVTNQPAADPTLQLLSASPHEKEVLTTPPTEVKLDFSAAVRPDKSSIRVLDAYGTRLEEEGIIANGMSLSVKLPALGPGQYTVKWRARCRCNADTDISDSFHFSVQ